MQPINIGHEILRNPAVLRRAGAPEFQGQEFGRRHVRRRFDPDVAVVAETPPLVPEHLIRPIDPAVVMLPKRRLPIDVFIPDRIPWLDLRLRRDQLTVPIAPSATVDNDTTYTSIDGSATLALPRYDIAFDRVGEVDESRIVVTQEAGIDVLTVTFVESRAAWPAGAVEMPHVLRASLRFRIPVLDGGAVVQDLAFASLTMDASETVLTAKLPLSSPGLRDRVVAALGSLDAAASFVIGRGVEYAYQDGVFDDGQPAFQVVDGIVEWFPQPSPIVLSGAQLTRLGGGAGSAMAPMIRIGVAFDGRTHPYWQDSATPQRFFFIPDRFALARTSDDGHRPLLRVRAAPGATVEDAKVQMEFQARPVVDKNRIQAALEKLGAAATARGAVGPVELEVFPEVQPTLRLALPGNAGALTARPDTQIDLELGLVHSETFSLSEFQSIHEAMFGASLTLLRGEVRVDAGGAPEDVPLELRFDRTVGQLLRIDVEPAAGGQFAATMTNAVESPVRIDSLRITGLLDAAPIDLTVSGLVAGQELAAGAAVSIRLQPADPPPDGALLTAIAIDESGVSPRPDSQAIWDVIFDAKAGGSLTRTITVQAVPALFTPGGDPDEVVAFVVTVRGGGSVTVTATELKATLDIAVPLVPLLTGTPAPPIEYQTQSVWGSGDIATSPWRAADSTILFPVRTKPTV
jgi:hypothetical protein